MASQAYTFLEFFAGAGMARAGLGHQFRCILANDIDAAKAASYRNNYCPASELIVGDIANITAAHVSAAADLAWASFPCQDLSLAGNGAGLKGTRSGTFWTFWKLMAELGGQGRAPTIIALENVYGTLTSRGGADFTAIVRALCEGGYRVGAMVIDAVHFVPQSRPRLFIVAHRADAGLPESLVSSAPESVWHTKAIVGAYEHFPKALKEKWLWWQVPASNDTRASLSSVIEEIPDSVDWNSPSKTAELLGMMSDLNRDKVAVAQRMQRTVVGTIYRRTRADGSGDKVQRAEVRFDGIAGCLRTPSGGSSRQTLIVVEGKRIRTRLLSSREVARLMGLPDSYKLPVNYNEAYHLAGDGVVVPVVRHLSRSLFLPLLRHALAKAA